MERKSLGMEVEQLKVLSICVLLLARSLFMSETESPCIGLCLLSENRKFCVGCYRTREEIVKWVKYSDKERSNIVSRLAIRKNRYEKN